MMILGCGCKGSKKGVHGEIKMLIQKIQELFDAQQPLYRYIFRQIPWGSSNVSQSSVVHVLDE